MRATASPTPEARLWKFVPSRILTEEYLFHKGKTHQIKRMEAGSAGNS